MIAAPSHAAEPVGARLLVQRAGAIVAPAPAGGTRRLGAGADATWSPDGTLVVVVRRGDLWLENADGSGARPLTDSHAAVESEPAWRRDGKAIAYTATVDGRRQLRLLDVETRRTRRLAPSNGEEWSPAYARDGRLAFVSTRDGAPEIETARGDGAAPQPFRVSDPALGDDQPANFRDLAWSPDGTRLAYTADTSSGTAVYVDDGATQTLLRPGSRPVWSPDGARIAFSDPAGKVALVDTDDNLSLASKGAGVPLDWRRVPLGRPRLPDLAQRPPSGLVVTYSGNRYRLGFTSLVDSRGPGPLWIRATRPPGARLMNVTQLVTLAGGGVRRLPAAGHLHFTNDPPHHHWHLLGFDRYELRRGSDFALVVRDRKSGFCLADHYGIAQGLPHGPPRFLGNCEQFHPEARSVEEGSSPGYTDRYPANFHGQSLDLTGVPSGRYWLVHRVNEDFRLRERRYDNDTASLLVRITWPGGHGSPPRVEPLRACPAERC
ncbi:MAG TPA: lysyl oxidase family protein [Gaiellaceae bacterium]|jgi:hypothetical protein